MTQVTEHAAIPMGGELRLEVIKRALPQRDLPADINEYRKKNAMNVLSAVPRLALARALHIPHFYGALYGKVIRGNGRVEDLGLLGLKMVTTAGVGFIVDAFQNIVELEDMKYHGFGSGSGAEATGNTALVTEYTTEYVTNSTRPTGTQIEGAANIYRTVATFAPDTGGTLAVIEHGIFSAAAVASGVLLDRTVFAAVNLVAAADSLQVTYDLTLTAGS